MDRFLFERMGIFRADRGAVVLILPANKKPNSRSEGRLVHPDSFQALDNEAIDRIHRLGGAVVRADENGQFEVAIDLQCGRWRSLSGFHCLKEWSSKRWRSPDERSICFAGRVLFLRSKI